MRKKLLSAFVAAVMLTAALPQSTSHAAEKYSAVKFGLLAGDKVSFGSGESSDYTAPQEFLVLDADISSTGDSDGAFLITSGVTNQTVTRTYGTISGTIPTECANFLKIFTEDEQELITVTSKKSTATIDSVTGLAEDTEDRKIFILSADEATKYSDLLKLNSGKEWALRSQKRSVLTSTITVGYITADNKPTVKSGIIVTDKFRPAMNIKKSLANVETPVGDKILLLPKKDFEEGKLSSAYSQNNEGYILPIKDSGIGAVNAQTISIERGSYIVHISAPRADGASPENEYITFIITDKNSENILDFGRFKKTASESNITFMLPDDVNADECKLYAFNEIYSEGKVSKISALTSACLKHDFKHMENLGSGLHSAVCQSCGFTENHTYTEIAPSGDENHTLKCTVCNYSGEEAHSKKLESKDSSEHEITCALCGYSKTASHNKQYKSVNNLNHTVACLDGCGYSQTEEHGSFSYTKYGNGHKKTCDLCGYAESLTHCMEYIDNGDDEIVRCKDCGYEEKGSHSYGKWVNKGETHDRVCSGCGKVQSGTHSYAGGEKFDSNEHKLTCAVCGKVKNESHNFKYISHNNGTHSKSCADCGYEIFERHTFEYINNGSVYRTLKCSVCGGIMNVKAAPLPVFDSVSKRSGAINLESAVCSYKNTSEQYVPKNLLDPKADDFHGRGAPDSYMTYTLAVDFAMTHPIALTGFLLTNAEDIESWYKQPEYIIISGKNDGDSDYTAITAIGTENFVPIKNNEVTTYLLTESVPSYKYYRIELVSKSDTMHVGLFTPLSAEGTEAEFELSGVFAENMNDLVVPGEDYECTLISRQGHPKGENVSVTFNSESFSDFSYSEETGILHIDGGKIKNGTYKISASAENEPVNVKTDLYRVTFAGADSAKFGEDYSGYFHDNDGKMDKLPEKSDVTVTIGGAAFDGFTYDEKTGELYISGKSITGDIEIKAYERASVKKDDSAIAVKKIDDIPRYYSETGKAAADISGANGAKLELLGDIKGNWKISKASAEFDLGGFAADADDEGTYLFNLLRSDMKFQNGYILAYDNQTAISAERGTVTLGSDLYIDAGRTGVELLEGASLIVDGAQIRGTDEAVNLLGGGSHLIVKSGVFKGYVKISEGSTAELSGGSFESILCRDYFSLLADGYAYKSTLEEERTIEEMFNDLCFVSVEKSPFTYSKENKQVDYGYKNSATLSANVTADAYQWYLGGEAIEDAVNSTYSVETGLAAGTYEYTCAAKLGSIYAPVKRVTFTVYCAHSNIGADGVCVNCGNTYFAAVTNKNEQTIFCQSVAEAVEAAKSGATVKLLADVQLTEDETKIYIYKKITFDLNNKTIFGVQDSDYKGEVSVECPATVKNGSIDADMYIEYEAADTVLENLKVSGEVWSRAETIKILSGEYGSISTLYSNLARFLENGKTLKSGNEWVDVDNESKCTDVYVTDAPFYFTKQPQSVLIKDADYTDSPVLSVEVQRRSGYENEQLTYQWYSSQYGDPEAIGGETGSTFKIPTGIGDGDAAYYLCRVSCGAYSRNSEEAAAAVGNIEPSFDIYDKGDDYVVCVDGNGLCGDVIIAGYNENGKMTDIASVKLTAENNYIEKSIYEDLGFGEKCKSLNIYLFDSLNGMTPYCKAGKRLLSDATEIM